MTNPSTPALEVKDLDLKIGGATILHDVNLEIQSGSIVGVIGPNGAGKTTLFNVISGIMTPTGGSVHIDGRDVTSMPIGARARVGLGRTFQTSNLFPRLTVLENTRIAAQIELGKSLSPFRFPHQNDTASANARNALDQVGLLHKQNAYAGDLSHGDKRKLEIAVLIATQTQLVLLDEPMAGVGSGDIGGLTEIIRKIHEESGSTVLLVEHHMEVLLGLVEKVAVMHGGTIIAFDTPKAIMENPVVQQAYLGVGAGA
ncbi:MAG TPA: ABC transporter ATP-binding protein [Microbacteriaceae bacterium]|nr:ABC transporter ATP-binding protein [Microbacteriaceae bacterium]